MHDCLTFLRFLCPPAPSRSRRVSGPVVPSLLSCGAAFVLSPCGLPGTARAGPRQPSDAALVHLAEMLGPALQAQHLGKGWPSGPAVRPSLPRRIGWSDFLAAIPSRLISP